jgi:hypothetical protein
VAEPRKSRRVRTEPVPGSDPAPQAPDRVELSREDAEESWGDRPVPGPNDDRLLEEKPPHY